MRKLLQLIVGSAITFIILHLILDLVIIPLESNNDITVNMLSQFLSIMIIICLLSFIWCIMCIMSLNGSDPRNILTTLDNHTAETLISNHEEPIINQKTGVEWVEIK